MEEKIDSLKIELSYEDKNKSANKVNALTRALEKLQKTANEMDFKGLDKLKNRLTNISKISFQKQVNQLKQISSLAKLFAKAEKEVVKTMDNINTQIGTEQVNPESTIPQAPPPQTTTEGEEEVLPNVDNSDDTEKAIAGYDRLAKKIEIFNGYNKNATATLTELRARLKEVAGKNDLRIKNIEVHVDKRCQVELDQLHEKMAVLQEKMKELQDGGVATDDKRFVKLDTQLSQIANKMGSLSAKNTSYARTLESIGKKGAKTTIALGKFFRSIIRIAGYRLMRTIISSITKAVREGLKNAATFSQDLKKSMNTLSGVGVYISNSIGAALIPLVTTLTPAIVKLAEGLVYVVNGLNQMMSLLTGKKTFVKAKNDVEGYAAALKKLNSVSAGFDELNTLNTGQINYSDSFEEVRISTLEATAGVAALGTAVVGVAGVFTMLGKIAPATLLKISKLVVTISGAIVALTSIIDICTNGMNWENMATAIGGVAVTVAGLTMTFGKTGGAIGLVVGGIALLVTGLIDVYKNGFNLKNIIPILLGIAAVVVAIGLLCGGWIPALIAAIVAAVAVGVVAIIKYWDEIKAWFIMVWTAICDWFTNAWTSTCNWFTNLWNSIVTFFQGVWDGICNIFSTVAEWFTNVFTNAWNGILGVWSTVRTWFSALWTDIQNTCSSCVNAIGTFFTDLWNNICNIWSTVSGWFNDNVITPVVGFFQNAASAIGGFFTGLWDGVSNGATTCWNWITSAFATVGEWFSGITTNIGSLFTTAWDGIKTGATNAWDGVKSVFSKVGDFFGDTFGKAWEKVTSIFKVNGDLFVDIKNGIVDAFKSIVNGLIKGINTVVGKPFEGINSMINTLKGISFFGLSPFSGLPTISVPQIPLLANGGFVNEGQLFIAREAGAELVGNIGGHTGVANNDQIIAGIKQGVYEAMLMAQTSNNSEGENNISISLSIDGKEIHDVVKKYDKRESTGKSIYKGGVIYG